MTEEIQLSDAEKRLLRRVFHRHARPYIAALGLVALIAVWGGPEEAAESEAFEPVAEATAPSVDVEALLDTQGRAEQLLAELQVSSEKRSAELDAAHRQIAALEKRLGATARRLAKVEGVARQALEAAAQARAKPPEAMEASAEISSAKAREAPGAASIQDKLRRMSSQEEQARLGAAREEISVPASPANAPLPVDPTP